MFYFNTVSKGHEGTSNDYKARRCLPTSSAVMMLKCVAVLALIVATTAVPIEFESKAQLSTEAQDSEFPIRTRARADGSLRMNEVWTKEQDAARGIKDDFTSPRPQVP